MRVLATIGLILLSGSAIAHDSPNDVIDRLTHQLEHGVTARLLVDRGLEYRAIGDTQAAEADFRAALALNKHYVPAHLTLAQMFVHEERIDDAVLIIETGLRESRDEDHRDEFLRLRAECEVHEHDWISAIASLDAMNTDLQGDLDTVLLRSAIRVNLNQLTLRVEELRIAFRDNAAVVIELELIEALRDAGLHDESLDRINEHLHNRKFKAEWLLRRAKTYHAMGETASMKTDLEVALVELENRLDVPRPDTQLFTLRDQARDLLGVSTSS